MMKHKSLLWAFIALAGVGAVAAQINISQFPGLVRIAQHQLEAAAGISLLIALFAGILTVTSPCGFVLLPTFFSFWFKERKRAVWMTVGFTLGMALAFTIMGIIVALLGNIYGQPKAYLGRFAGLILITFAIMLFLNKGFSIFNFKVEHTPNRSFWSIFALGFSFSLGWTPCIGPVLGGILVLAAKAGQPFAGGMLMFTYALGVAIPLLVLAYLSDRGDWAGKKWLTGTHLRFKLFGKRIITHTYNIIGGTFLLLIGSVMLWDNGTQWFMKTIPTYLPWNMTFFERWNQVFMGECGTFEGMTRSACHVFRDSPWVRDIIGNGLGLLLIAGIGFLIWRHVKKNKSARPSKKQQCE